MFSFSVGPQRATLAEKEVTTLKEQLATTSPTPLQANIPPKTPNGNTHLEASVRDQATDTRITEHRFSDLRISPQVDKREAETPERNALNEDPVDTQKMEMAATARSNTNSSRSSPTVGSQGANLEGELAAKEKEVSFSKKNYILFFICRTSVNFIAHNWEPKPIKNKICVTSAN